MSDKPTETRHPQSVPIISTSQDVTAALLAARALDAPPRPGLLASLDRFEILGVLGQGGMGVVLLARDPATDVKVAIKMLRPELRHSPHVVKRFLAEARHMYKLDHPHILRVLEVGDRPAGPYYVMVYKERGSLAGLIKPGEPVEAELTLSVARQVAEALAYAHAQGILHRDVKPFNVLLDADGRTHLADFGLVRAFDRNESIVEPGHEGRLGTVAYMSPAVAKGEAEDTRCDIYSFGALLYEMLTGEPPYTASSRDAIFAQILAGPPTPIRARNPKAPAGLVTIAEGCMARELRDRYASMADVVTDLKRIEAGQSPLGPHGQPRSSEPHRARRWMAIGAAALAVVAAVATWRSQPHPKTPGISEEPISSSIPTNGLVAYYPFEGSPADASGQAHDGLEHGEVRYVEGRVGQGAAFNGEDGYIGVPDLIRASPAGSISLWFRPETWKLGPMGTYVWAAADAEPPNGPFLRTAMGCLGDRQVAFGIFDSGKWYWAGSRTVPVNHTWFHAVGVWGSQGLRIYLNGELRGENGFTGPAPQARVNLIGCGSFAQSFACGVIDEVRVYNRALSADEIRRLYSCASDKTSSVGSRTAARPAAPTDIESLLREAKRALAAPLDVAIPVRPEDTPKIKAARAALEKYPEDHEAALALFHAYWAASRLDDALQAVLRAVALRPQQPEPWSQLAYVCAVNHRPDDGLRAAAEALRLKPDSSFAWHVIGVCRRSRGELEPAINAFRRALELAPSDVQSLRLTAFCLADLGRPDEAESFARRALELAPDPGSFWTLAATLEARFQFSQAIAAREQILKLDPKDEANKAKLAELAPLKAEAIRNAEQAVAKDPKGPKEWVNMAWTLNGVNQWDRGIAAARRAVQVGPNDPLALACLAFCLSSRNHNDPEALKLALRVTELAPKSAEPWDPTARVFEFAGRLPDAINAWQKAIEYNPKHQLAMQYLANDLRAAGRLEESLEMGKRLVALAPGYEWGWLGLGLTQRALNRNAESIRSLEISLCLNPDQPQDLLNEALEHTGVKPEPSATQPATTSRPVRPTREDLLRVAPDDSAAVKEARRQAASSPEDWRRWTRVADALGQSGKSSGAAEAARQAVRLAADDAETWRYLVRYSWAGAKPIDALRANRHLVELAPKDAEAWADLALVAGGTPESLNAAKKALELAPESAKSWWGVAEAHQAAAWKSPDHWLEAVKARRRCIEIDPKDAYAWQQLSLCLGHAGDVEGAISAAERSISLKRDNPFAWMNVASALGTAKRYEESAKAWEELLRLDPKWAGAQAELDNMRAKAKASGKAATQPVAASQPVVVVAESSQRNLWTVRESVRFTGHRSFVRSVAISPDARFVLSASDDATVRLWDARTTKEIRRLTQMGTGFAYDRATFSRDGRLAIGAGWNDRLQKSVIGVWDVPSGKERRMIELANAQVMGVALSPDARLMAGGTTIDGKIYIWDVGTGKELRQYRAHQGSVHSLVFSPDGQQLVSGSWDSTISIWDVQSGREIRRFVGHREPVWCVAMSSDGLRILSASGNQQLRDGRWVPNAIDNSIRLWDAVTGQALLSLEGHKGVVWSTAISPDARFAASVDDDIVRVWDLTKGREVGWLEGHKGAVNAVAFSPDGLSAVSCGLDNTVRLWRLPLGPPIQGGARATQPVSTTQPAPTTQPAELAIDLGGGVKMEFVRIPAGEFMMGSVYGDANEQPVHKVTISKPFDMGRYEVTQEQWLAVIGSNPSNFKGTKNPVEQVSWVDCQEFVAKLNTKVKGHTFRLPTEAEWEYACRGGSTTAYAFGDAESELGNHAWYSANSDKKTHPVGQRKPNAWGLYDMHGNVWEWCQDWHGTYAGASKTDPTGPASDDGRGRVLRGGSWFFGVARDCRCTRRGNVVPSGRSYDVGFRVAMDIEDKTAAAQPGR